jgi:hypothetical protein
MNKSYSRTWLGFLAEGLVVIASILLAFAIDAWWDRRGEQEREAEVLAALEHEMIQNKQGIETTLESHDRTHQAALAFLGSTPEEIGSLSADSAAVLGSWLFRVRVFTPLEGVMNGEELSAIRDPELRLALATWGGISMDQAENRPELWDLAQVVWRNRAIARGIGYGSPLDAIALQRLRADPALWADLEVHDMVRQGDAGKLTRLLQQTDEVLRLLRDRGR